MSVTVSFDETYDWETLCTERDREITFVVLIARLIPWLFLHFKHANRELGMNCVLLLPPCFRALIDPPPPLSLSLCHLVSSLFVFILFIIKYGLPPARLASTDWRVEYDSKCSRNSWRNSVCQSPLTLVQRRKVNEFSHQSFTHAVRRSRSIYQAHRLDIS